METGTAQLESANEIVDAVDRAHGKAWHIWRAALGHWCVQVKPNHNVDGATLEDALRNAAAWRDLPAVRRKPTTLYLHRFQAVRDGSKWSLLYDGQRVCGYIATKTKAMESAQGFCDRAANALAEWESLYGETVASGTEGVDFRYVD